MVSIFVNFGFPIFNLFELGCVVVQSGAPRHGQPRRVVVDQLRQGLPQGGGLRARGAIPFAGAVAAKILVLVLIILFLQKRPRGMFALRGRSIES